MFSMGRSVRWSGGRADWQLGGWAEGVAELARGRNGRSGKGLDGT